jgi:hypothetical protein
MTGCLTLKSGETFPHILREQTKKPEFYSITRVIQQERIRGDIWEFHGLLSSGFVCLSFRLAVLASLQYLYSAHISDFTYRVNPRFPGCYNLFHLGLSPLFFSSPRHARTIMQL